MKKIVKLSFRRQLIILTIGEQLILNWVVDALILNVPIVNNENISWKHLGYKGLHLNSYGSSRLAMNSISVFRKFGCGATY